MCLQKNYQISNKQFKIDNQTSSASISKSENMELAPFTVSTSKYGQASCYPAANSYSRKVANDASTIIPSGLEMAAKE